MRDDYLLPGLVLGALVLLYVKRDAIGGAVNPTNRDNLAYRGVTQIGDVLDDGADNDSFNLGASIFRTIGDYREWFD